MKHKTLGLALAALVVAATSWSAPALDARTIMKRVNDRDDGKDAYAKVEMFLTAAGGYSEKRSLIQAYKYFGGLRKTYTRFTEPASIDGTSFLSWQRGNDLDDDQFLYLPELGRDRRIVSSQKDGDFVNTDFTYEDMQERSVDKDNHTLVREEKIGTYDCWVIESAPKDPASSQYRRWVAWVPKDIYVPLRVEFYTKVVRQPNGLRAERRQKASRPRSIRKPAPNTQSAIRPVAMPAMPRARAVPSFAATSCRKTASATTSASRAMVARR